MDENVNNIKSWQELIAVDGNSEVEYEDISSGTLMERPFNPKDIDIKSKTMSLDNIIKRLQHGAIDLQTEFQRNMDLWPPDKQSQLIESVLISFPLPAFYFDGTDDNRWLVVDGLQRLSAINNFVVKKTLKLTGLEFLEKLDGASFDDLPRNLQRKIEEAEIISYVINPGTPLKVKFNIFKRINTGGLVLTPQEIRHALNQGVPSTFVAELAEVNEFKQATENVVSPKRMLDREFVTRFLAFFLNSPDDYKPDLDSFLNDSMQQVNALSQIERDSIVVNFTEAMRLAEQILGKWAFRKVFDVNERRKPINKALFEVWSVTFAKLNMGERIELFRNKEDFFQSFVNLMNNDNKFIASITSATGDKSRVAYRFEKIRELVYRYTRNL